MFIFCFLDEAAVCWFKFEVSFGIIKGCDSSLCNDIDRVTIGVCQCVFIFSFIDMSCTLEAIKASS